MGSISRWAISVGHWEGRHAGGGYWLTSNDKTWLDSARYIHSSDELHVVEPVHARWTQTLINYEATIEDPEDLQLGRGKSAMPFHRNTEPDFELREQECTEADNGRAIHPPYRRPASRAIYLSSSGPIPKNRPANKRTV